MLTRDMPSLQMRDLADGTREITNAPVMMSAPQLSMPMSPQKSPAAPDVMPPVKNPLGPLPQLQAKPGQSIFNSMLALSNDSANYRETAIANRQSQTDFNNRVKAATIHETGRHNKATEFIQNKIAEIRKEFGAGADTALAKNMDLLIRTGVAKTHDEAWDKLRTTMGKSDEDAILGLAGTFMRGNGYLGKNGWQRALDDATTAVQTVRKSQMHNQAQSGTPGATAGASASPSSRSYTVSGKTFTDADIESTAKIHGISADQVKQRLGIR